MVEAIDPSTGAVIPAGGPIRPGQTLLRYTISFQASDEYAFDNVVLRDVLSDGQRLFLGTRGAVTAGLPTLQVSNAFLANGTGPGVGSRTDVAAAAFSAAGSIGYDRRYTTEATLPAGTDSDPTSFPAAGPANGVFSNTASAADGSTGLTFDVSAELRQRLGAAGGRLVGGAIGNDGTGPGNFDVPTVPFGGATGTVVFYTEVSRDFSDDFPSGDRSVDQGDVLSNSVDDPRTGGRDGVTGTQLRPNTINAVTPTAIGTGTDDSGTRLVIPYGQQEKQIYARRCCVTI